MATIGSLVVNLIANTAGFSAGMQKGVKDTKAFESRLKSVSSGVKSLAGVLGIAGGAFTAGSFIKGALDEAMEAERVMKQLETVIKSTGGAAGFSAQQISDFAGELQKTTTFADDTTKAAAAVLATFTNIQGDVFKGAIVAAQDLNTALGGDLQSNIIQIGKALNDPVKGISALTRVGVSFTEQQKDQIKALVENGEAMKAQKIILAELAKEFGGSAAAAVDTMSGKLSQLTNRWNDFKETTGETLVLPVVDALADTADWYKNYVDNVDEWMAKNWGWGSDKLIEYGTYGGKAKTPKMAPPRPSGALSKEQFTALYGTEFGKPRATGKIGLQGFEMGLAGAMKRTFTKNTALSGLLDTAFGSQFIGKNRENLRGGGRSQFDAWSAARNPMMQNFRPEYRPLAALERGSAEAYSAINASKASPFTELNTTAKKQLVAQQQTAANTAKMGTPNVIAMGN